MADLPSFEEWQARKKAEHGENYKQWYLDKFEEANSNRKKKRKKSVKPEKLSDEIAGAVMECFVDVKGATEEMILQVASETVKELKKISPVYKGKNKNTPKGKYRKSWRMTSKMTATGLKATVHNTNYQLTHLLENQHLNRDGTTYSTAIPHISIASKHAEERLKQLLEGL